MHIEILNNCGLNPGLCSKKYCKYLISNISNISIEYILNNSRSHLGPNSMRNIGTNNEYIIVEPSLAPSQKI